MTKRSDSVKKWRENLKIRALRLFGNSCNICGYTKCKEALEFHHLNPEEKDFSLSSVYKNPVSWYKIVQELRKCILVCANCHREVHYNKISIDVNKTYLLDEYINYNLFEGNTHLCACGTEMLISKKYCSKECQTKYTQVVDWNIERENIIKYKEVDKLPYTKIALMYNTSDKTIAKWYKKFKN